MEIRVGGEISSGAEDAGDLFGATRIRNPVEDGVGSYRVVGFLGEGGMGSVYRGRHKIDAFAEQGGDVAIKSMKAEYATNPAFRERFIREAGLGRRLHHRNIARCLDVVVEDDVLALVMEYVEGVELKSMIGRGNGKGAGRIIDQARSRSLGLFT